MNLHVRFEINRTILQCLNAILKGCIKQTIYIITKQMKIYNVKDRASEEKVSVT